MSNIYALPRGLPASSGPGAAPEYVETLINGTGGLFIERIVSNGHATPENEWYDQEKDEWVVVLEGSARLRYEDGTEVALAQGEHLLIPAHVRHRVVYTSSPCLWLAVHARGLTRPAA